MPTVHVFLQIKGGVGKTTTCAFFAEYLLSKNYTVKLFDIDPGNKSLTEYKTLNVIPYDFYNENNKSDYHLLDALWDDQILDCHENEQILFDVGASGFETFSNYLFNSGIKSLQEYGINTLIHNSIPGGDMLKSSLLGLDKIIDVIPDTVKIQVWLNYFFGNVSYEDISSFEDFAIYKNNITKFICLTPIGRYDEMHTNALVEMISHRLTFNDVLSRSTYFQDICKHHSNDQKFYLHRRSVQSRLKTIRDGLYKLLDLVNYNELSEQYKFINAFDSDGGSDGQ